jgi:hypothetical protein
VQPRADRAGDGLVGLAFALGRIVSDPALHVQAHIWTAVDEGGMSAQCRAATTGALRFGYGRPLRGGNNRYVG